MSDWYIHITFTSEKSLAEEVAFDVLESFAEYSASSAIGEHEGSIRLAVSAEGIDFAITKASELMLEVKKVIGEVEVTSFTVQSEDELKAYLDAPNPYDLVGLAEIAEILAVSKQRAHAIAKLENFPRVLVEVASGRLWARDEVIDWYSKWERKSGRRTISSAK